MRKGDFVAKHSRWPTETSCHLARLTRQFLIIFVGLIMFKRLAIICALAGLIFTAAAEAKTKKKSKSRAGKSSSRQYRPSKHARKSRRFRHHGNGPDLKAITTESPYKEDPSNGVTPVETKQPGL